jgi:hypothetical protein
MNIKELKAQVAAVKKANKAKLEEKVQVALLQAQLTVETNESLLEAKALLATRNEQTRKLTMLVDECKSIVDNMPIYNSKTDDNRKWVTKYRSAFGNQINLVYQLVTGILYSCQEHKEFLLAHIGLNQELIEQTNHAFGSPAYYNRNYNVVVEATAYDLDMVKAHLKILQSELGITFDMSELTKENFDKEFQRAELLAQKVYEEAQEAIAEADMEFAM